MSLDRLEEPDEPMNTNDELRKAIEQIAITRSHGYSVIEGYHYPEWAIKQIENAAKQLESLTKERDELKQEQAAIRTGFQREFDGSIADDEDVLDLMDKFIDHHKAKEQQLSELRAERDTFKATALGCATTIQELRAVLKEAGEALNIAVGTVECASVFLNTQEELPWYKQAKSTLSNPLMQQVMKEPNQ